MASGNPQQRLLDKYGINVWEEWNHQRKLREILEDVVKCEDDDELEILESKIEDMKNNVRYFQIMQNEIIEKVFNGVRWGFMQRD